jgi:hypothetical protein
MPATKSPPKINAYSYSRLKVWTSCALAYALQYLDKHGQDESGPLQVGAAAHEFFDQWTKTMQNTMSDVFEGKREEVLLKIASECFQKEGRDQSHFRDYLEICRTFAANYVQEDGYEKEDSELELAFDVAWKKVDWFAPEVRFRGKIDLLQIKGSTAKITDYKTGYAGKIDPFQLEIYGLLVSLAYPKITRLCVEFYFVQSGFRENKALDVKDMGIIKVQLEALMLAIDKARKFKAKPGSKCLTCNVAAFCDQKASDLVAIKSQKQAETLAAEAAMLDVQRKAKIKTLKVWAEQHGEIHAAGLIYAHFPKEEFSLDVPSFLDLCKMSDLDPSDYLSAGATKIKKLCKDHPELSDLVANMTEVNQTLSFYAKKEEAE